MQQSYQHLAETEWKYNYGEIHQDMPFLCSDRDVIYRNPHYRRTPKQIEEHYNPYDPDVGYYYKLKDIQGPPEPPAPRDPSLDGVPF